MVISGHGTVETAVQATKLGAFDFLEKPLSLDKVVLTVKNALRQHRLEEENVQLRERLGPATPRREEPAHPAAPRGDPAGGPDRTAGS